MPAPFGHATVPPSRKKLRKRFGAFSGSNTGPFSHSRKSIVFSESSLNVTWMR
jgi:hypothetical protein